VFVDFTHSIANLEELTGVLGDVDNTLQLFFIHLFLTTAITGDVTVNNLVVGQGVYKMPLDKSGIILPLPQLLRQLVLLHLVFLSSV
jgi:hypothetical protein